MLILHFRSFLSPWIQIRRIRIQKAPESGSETLVLDPYPTYFRLKVYKQKFFFNLTNYDEHVTNIKNIEITKLMFMILFNILATVSQQIHWAYPDLSSQYLFGSCKLIRNG